jgi:hypothetical protein
LPDLHIKVTETLRVELRMSVATRFDTVRVSAYSALAQTDSSSLGRVVNDKAISELPLATRNFTQIAGLSTGVTVGVYNAGELGIGGTALSQIGTSNDGIFVRGSRSYANNWQEDGISVSDILGAGAASGGIPISNPDTIQEFKVQTGLYDAALGRTAGANISVITKTGTGQFHGTIFEFVRNNVLNANDYFFNDTGQPRPDLKQNQFGFALGGPIRRDNIHFFSSYQRTQQINGMAAGQARIGCAASLNEPPLPNDRSRQSLGELFGGLKGANGGIAIRSDGSNINPVALALLNLKLPDGSFLIPSPHVVDDSKPIASRGLSVLTQPCRFTEDQGLGNLDYIGLQKHHLAARFFISDSSESVTFPGSGLNPVENIRGFDSPVDSAFHVFSLAHTYLASNSSLNEVRIGLVNTRVQSRSTAPFRWSDIGVAEGEMNENNELPNLNILGSVSMASAFPRTYAQNTTSFSDLLTFQHGGHLIKAGGAVLRLQENLDILGLGSSVQFLSWPDFLLGLNAAANGTGTFSNVFDSSDVFGLLYRDFGAWEGSGFVQDDYRIKRNLTLNLGLRFERLGQFGDNLGRNSSFDVSKADANPPSSGSFDGYIVGSNFRGTLPPGVVRANNTFATYGDGQNTIAPRTGFSWQVFPGTTRLILRGGYGIYYSRQTGGASATSVTGAPFSLTRISTGPANVEASFQAPFAQPFPTVSSFPLFVPYSPTTNETLFTLAPTFRPAMVNQFSLNLQSEVKRGWLLEIGYTGTRGTHLQRFRSLNQALDASTDNPVRGVTSNTLANLEQRVPVPGIHPDALREMESEGASWYNGLETSLTKGLSHGIQFFLSYTFSKTLDTDGANINGSSAGNTLTLGDQDSGSQRWGRASFDRTHRLVFSQTWELPSPLRGLKRAALGGWNLTAVLTVQSGGALTIADTNSTNVFGITEDRAQLSGKCSRRELVTGGTVQSKLNQYFNESCFTTPPIIGADGIGTDFGNSATGIVNGPAQANLDIAISRTVPVNWPIENSAIQFRAEFFNALNHPQFANPDTNFASPTFGVISSTSVNPRVGQVAIKLTF